MAKKVAGPQVEMKPVETENMSMVPPSHMHETMPAGELHDGHQKALKGLASQMVKMSQTGKTRNPKGMGKSVVKAAIAKEKAKMKY